LLIVILKGKWQHFLSWDIGPRGSWEIRCRGSHMGREDILLGSIRAKEILKGPMRDLPPLRDSHTRMNFLKLNIVEGQYRIRILTNRSAIL
jgi:hypothetical protein